MGEHFGHVIHDNSIETFHSIDREKRREMVFRVYEESYEPLSDRDVATRLNFSDMNSARPRISELILSHRLKEVGNRKDSVTGKTVRVCCPADRVEIISDADGQRRFA
jgi:hypothetical protein